MATNKKSKLKQLSKPKTLLIFPPSTVYFGDPTVPALTPPLGLAYLASYLEKYYYPVTILDSIAEGNNKLFTNKKEGYCRYGLNDSQVLNQIKKNSPDIIGISCMYSAYAGDAHRMAKLAKSLNPKTLVVVGGAHASIFPELTLKDKNIDIVVSGEGELTLLEIVKRFEEGKSLSNIPGTLVRKGKKIKSNPPREYLKDIDSIPFPSWHLLPMEKYLSVKGQDYAMRRPGMVMITSRGCPGRCIYCSIHSVWGNSWRGRSPKNVVDEIEKLVIEYGINEFYFFDDSMGANKKRLGKICDEIIKRKLDIRWSPPNGIAHWTLDEKLLEKMKKAGCYRITFGIESGNLETRKFIGKPYDLSQAKKMIKHANKIGMWTICTNIIGFPYETRQQIQDTIDFAVKSGTDLAVFYLLCPHPGTKVYDIFKSEGLIDLDKIFSPYKKYQTEDFAEIGQVLAGRGAATKNFSKEELQVIVSEAYRSFLLKRLTSFLDLRRIFNKIHSWEDFLFVVKIGRNSFKVILRNISHRTFGSQMLKRDVK